MVQEKPTSNRFINFLFSNKSLWFWITVSFTLLAFISILLLPATETPLSYLRYLFGFVLAAFLPGYCLTETLFPSRNSVDAIERFTFSVGLSFAVTALVSLLLSLSPIGFTLQSALLTLSTIVFLLELIALYRKYTAKQ